MGRIPTTTAKKLRAVVQLLWEVSEELEDRKPFYSTLCRSLAEALTRSIEEHYASFILNLPTHSLTILRSIRAGAPAPYLKGSGSVRITSDL